MELPDVNLVQIILSFMTCFILFMGSLINWFEAYLPVFFPQTFRYGKFAYSGKPSNIKVVEVPKSWFKHFYVFASLYSLYALQNLMDVYLYGAHPSKYLIMYLDFLSGSSRKTDCDSTTVIVALSLFTLQCLRRFYETWFISVFSNGKINFSQYMVGYIHYWLAITAILAEATGFKSIGAKIVQGSLTPLQILGVILFLYAWINQYNSNKILANLRKNACGEVISTEHKVAQGGLFTYVSSPHMFCEVLIYTSLWMILYKNYVFKYVFIWVLSNQIETALLNHWWYQKRFKNYPKERKAIFPFVL